MTRNPKKVTLLRTLNIDIEIQSQALNFHALTSQLYIIMCKVKAPIYKFSSAKRPKHSEIAMAIIAITDTREKPADLLYCTTWASTLAPAIILLASVPLLKFPFL